MICFLVYLRLTSKASAGSSAGRVLIIMQGSLPTVLNSTVTLTMTVAVTMRGGCSRSMDMNMMVASAPAARVRARVTVTFPGGLP